jgi:hypothetical protein
MSIDAVFDEDYEFVIIFTGNIYMKNENRKNTSAFWHVIQDISIISYAIIALITLINAIFHKL